MMKLLSPRSSRKKPPRVFGASLEQLMMKCDTCSRFKLPPILKKTVNHIHNYGMETLGIFRVNGNVRLVEKLRAEFETSGDADLSDCTDVTTVASLLKQFFRELPEPLVPDTVEQRLVKVKQNSSDVISDVDISEIRSLMSELPSRNVCILSYLCRFLYEVSSHSLSNKMTIESLAIVFAPNLLRGCERMELNFTNQKVANDVMNILIGHCSDIWSVDASDRMVTCVCDKFINGIYLSKPILVRPASPNTIRSPGVLKPKPSDEIEPPASNDGQGNHLASNNAYCPSMNNDSVDLSSMLMDSSESGHTPIASPLTTTSMTEFMEDLIHDAINEHLFGLTGSSRSSDEFSGSRPQVDPSSTDPSKSETPSNIDSSMIDSSSTEPSPSPRDRRRAKKKKIPSSPHPINIPRVILDDDITTDSQPIASTDDAVNGREDLLLGVGDLYRGGSDDVMNINGSRCLTVSTDETSAFVPMLDLTDLSYVNDSSENSADRSHELQQANRVSPAAQTNPNQTAQIQPSKQTPDARKPTNGRDVLTESDKHQSGVNTSPVTMTNQKPRRADRPQKQTNQKTEASHESTYNNEEKDKLTNNRAGSNKIESNQRMMSSLKQACRAAESRLAQIRTNANRPSDLEEMKVNEIIEEKVATQKELLYIENQYGRPNTKAERSVVKCLYDRYRRIKQLLAQVNATDNIINTHTDRHRVKHLQVRVPHLSTTDPGGILGDSVGGSEMMSVTQDLALLKQRLSEAPGSTENITGPDIDVKLLHSATREKLFEDVRLLKDKKRRLHKVLKSFEVEFAETYGRKPIKDDRMCLHQQYKDYKDIKGNLKLLIALLSKS